MNDDFFFWFSLLLFHANRIQDCCSLVCKQANCRLACQPIYSSPGLIYTHHCWLAIQGQVAGLRRNLLTTRSLRKFTCLCSDFSRQFIRRVKDFYSGPINYYVCQCKYFNFSTMNFKEKVTFICLLLCCYYGLDAKGKLRVF